MCIHNEKCNKPRHAKGYPGKVCSKFLYTETIKLYCIVWIPRLKGLGSAMYPKMQMGIQEKTRTNIKSGQTGKCNIPIYENGYPGKDIET